MSASSAPRVRRPSAWSLELSRIPVTVRPALPVDVPALREVWADVVRRGDEASQLTDLHQVVARATASDDQLIVVAECGGRVAGAVFLQATTLTPLNLEPTVFAVSPHVLAQYRRRGVGTALMEASVRFAEEQGIGQMASGAAAEWRDANRFMARLSLVPHAVLRLAPTAVVRSRLSSVRPMSGRGRARSVDRVLAARRTRRSERVATG